MAGSMSDLERENKMLRKQLEAMTEKLIACEGERDRFFEQKRIGAGRYAEERGIRQEYEASLRRIKKLAMKGLPPCGSAGAIIMAVKSALGEDSE